MAFSLAKLTHLLKTEGPNTPAALTARLEISQPTLFRAVKSQPETLMAVGAGRNRQVAALRSPRGLGSELPLFAVSTDGKIIQIGKLFPIYPRHMIFVREIAPTHPELFSALPFFLDDVRPQGFLGRTLTQKFPELQLPPQVLNWGSDDILEAIARRGEDLPGNLLVGGESFNRYQMLIRMKPTSISASTPEKAYATLAQAAVEGQPAGSSAGGENPKFCTIVEDEMGDPHHVLVKFSPKGQTFAAERWHDLLICESLALGLLRDNQISAVENRIVEADGRTFLETTRTDRTGRYGRRGLLSLSALENQWIDRGKNWSESGQRLAEVKMISLEDLIMIKKLECFGRLIANPDRHSGNLSFFWQPGPAKPQLAPVYDMLPMLYAPSASGENTQKTFSFPHHDHTLLSVWPWALRLAIKYWEQVIDDPRLSKPFIQIAEKNLHILSSD